MIILFLNFGVCQRIILKNEEIANIGMYAVTVDLFVQKKEVFMQREDFVPTIHT